MNHTRPAANPNTNAVFLTDERTHAATRARLLAAHRLGIVAPGSVVTAAIAHDDACPALAGGPCRCVPDITVTGRDGKRWVDVGRGFERAP